jgi:hypothetical protein
MGKGTAHGKATPVGRFDPAARSGYFRLDRDRHRRRRRDRRAGPGAIGERVGPDEARPRLVGERAIGPEGEGPVGRRAGQDGGQPAPLRIAVVREDPRRTNLQRLVRRGPVAVIASRRRVIDRKDRDRHGRRPGGRLAVARGEGEGVGAAVVRGRRVDEVRRRAAQGPMGRPAHHGEGQGIAVDVFAGQHDRRRDVLRGGRRLGIGRRWIVGGARLEAQDGDPVVLHAVVVVAPGHGVALVIPGVAQVDHVPRPVVPVAEHGMAGNLDDHGPTGVDLPHVVLEAEPQGVSVVAQDELGEVLDDPIPPGLDEEAEAMASIPPAVRVDVIVERGAIRVAPERRPAIDVAELRLVGAHEVGGAVPVGMLRPAVEDVRIGAEVEVGDPVIVDVPPPASPIVALMGRAQGALAVAPVRIGQGTDPTVGRSEVHVEIGVVVVVPHHHRGRRGRASVAPVEGGNVGQDDIPEGRRGHGGLHAEVRGGPPGDVDLHDRPPVDGGGAPDVLLDGFKPGRLRPAGAGRDGGEEEEDGERERPAGDANVIHGDPFPSHGRPGNGSPSLERNEPASRPSRGGDSRVDPAWDPPRSLLPGTSGSPSPSSELCRASRPSFDRAVLS